MSEHTATAAASPQLSFAQKHHFLLRRLHSLTGVLPIGVFLIEHLFTNSAIVRGDGEFQHDIDFIYNLPALQMMEIFGIWLPIAFHAILGVVYVFSGKPNVTSYGYQANWRYSLMRITGMIGVFYIFFHVATTRWRWNIAGWYTPFHHEIAAESTAYAVQFAWPLVVIFYLIGSLALVYHFANGLWTFAITWGLTVTENAQRRWGWVCLGLGLLLTAASLASIYGFATYELPEGFHPDQAVKAVEGH